MSMLFYKLLLLEELIELTLSQQLLLKELMELTLSQKQQVL